MKFFNFDKNYALGALTVLTVLLFSACSPNVTIQATGTDGATISFSTGFSAAAEQTIKSIMSAVGGEEQADAPLFTAADITALAQSAGLQNVTATVTDATNIATSGTLPRVSQSALAAAGMVTRTTNSLTLTLGAAQFKALYALLDEETQAYFDLLMIPALNDEQLSAAEYDDVLASVYGKTFAHDMTHGTFSVTLLSPDGKKTITASLTMGELLTLTQEKRWTVTW